MNKLAKRSLLAALLGFGLTVAASAYAQTCGGKGEPPCPPPKAPADCSPGFYKNHPEAWCDVVCPTTGTVLFTGGACDLLVTFLSVKGPGSEAIRDAAKAQIDACFGTAAASPCTDD